MLHSEQWGLETTAVCDHSTPPLKIPSTTYFNGSNCKYSIIFINKYNGKRPKATRQANSPSLFGGSANKQQEQ